MSLDMRAKAFTETHLARLREAWTDARRQQASVMRRGVLRKTHCVQGHWLHGENVVQRRDGRRECRVCKRARDRYAA